jgi:hypothetical protein
VPPRRQARAEDAELRGDVLQALMLDTLVPTTIEASVTDGFVTLTGTAERYYQREEAEFIAGNVLGVTGVEDDVYLSWPTPSAGDVQHHSGPDADLLGVAPLMSGRGLSARSTT